MKVHASVAFALIFNCAFSQFAVIDDKDGYVNIREKADLKSDVIGKLTTSDIFWCLWLEGDWYQVDTDHGSGYIHKSRVKFISTFTVVPKTRIEPNQLFFKGDEVKIEITTKAFKESENKIEFLTRGDQKDVSKINGERTWGNFGTMPHEEYAHVNYTLWNKTNSLPKGAISNLFNPNLTSTQAYFDEIKKIIYITANNSDGAGAYALVWIVTDGKYLKRKMLIPF